MGQDRDGVDVEKEEEWMDDYIIVIVEAFVLILQVWIAAG